MMYITDFKMGKIGLLEILHIKSSLIRHEEGTLSCMIVSNSRTFHVSPLAGEKWVLNLIKSD